VIPIVFASAGDPVGNGIVENLARPNGNITGMSAQATDSAPKRLELLREAVPTLRTLAIMANVGNPFSMLEVTEVQGAARTLGINTATSEIRQVEDIAPAFDLIKGHAEALFLSTDPLLVTNRMRINTLAQSMQMPTIGSWREFVEAGSLMSYGSNIPDQFRRAAEYVDKILRGVKPADLPVEQPTKFDLIINLKTAKILGIEIPATLLARADEVIE
jgi:putative ABC transport system substrate-binding protein